MKILTAAGLLVIAAAVFHPSPSLAAPAQCSVKNKLYTCSIDTNADPAALCNDGSVPAFWYRPGKGTGVNQWIIWLGGGGTCDDQPSCAVRATKNAAVTMSSNGFYATNGQGILSASSTINPQLYNYNSIVVHYCSSDTWSGNKASSGLPFDPNDSTTWHFQGRRIALAAINSIGELFPSLHSATKIILGGDSSGGVGVTITANDIIPMLPAAATKLLVNDAGLTLNIGQFDKTAGAPYVYQGHPNVYENDLQQRLSYWNARGDAVCDAAAVTPLDHANCYDSAYVLQHGFITIPAFVAEAQLDTSQITQELCPASYGYCPVSHNPSTPQGIYAAAFGQQMITKVVGDANTTYSAYTPDLYYHVLLDNTADFTTQLQFPSGGLAPVEAFDAWVVNPTGARVVSIGNAPGVN